ncbi:MAG: hypothetical protein QOD91_1496, partial [Frankiales bacterium]|nr:hypothetical protein [Frankiales bacterium]
ADRAEKLRRQVARTVFRADTSQQV